MSTPSTRSPTFYPKLALAAGYKALGLQKKRQHRFRIDFRVDPDSPTGYRDIDAYEFRK